MKLIGLILAGSTALAYGQLFEKRLEVGNDAPKFTGTTLTGATVKLEDFSGKLVVLEWVNYSCPWVKKHYVSGNMQRLQKKCADQGGVWISVATGFTANATKLQKGFSEYDSKARHLVLDEDGTIGKLFNAKSTPHCFVINKGVLIYEGATDSNKSVKPESVKEAMNYVETILDAHAEKKELPSLTAKPYGSRVMYKDL